MMSKILIVEDNSILRKSLKTILERASYEVEEAQDGEQGIEAVENGNIDLVITDYQMPRMNGKKLVEKIRETNPDFPCIMISSIFPEDITTLDIPFLRKPFQFEKLIELTEDFLNK